MKLFVWTGFCPDYSDGLAFAIAKNEKEAKKMIEASRGNIYDWGSLEIHSINKPIAFAVSGGS